MKLSKWSLTFIVASISISIISGFIIFYFTRNPNSYLASFLTFFALSLIRLQVLSEKNYHLYQRIISILNALNIKDKFSELSVMYNLNLLGSFSDEVIKVEKDEVLNFWYEGVSRVQQSNKALTYALPDETWSLGWNKIALGIQQERISTGCHFERIFILDKYEDLKVYEKSIKEQNEIGITTRKLYKEDLLKKKIIRNALKEIGTIDFSIKDNYWISRVYLNKKRLITKSDASRNKELVKKAKLVFQEAQMISEIWEIT